MCDGEVGVDKIVVIGVVDVVVDFTISIQEYDDTLIAFKSDSIDVVAVVVVVVVLIDDVE